MEEGLSKSYEPKEVEKKWLAYWESNETFKAEPAKSGEPYAIVIPPPNVTGVLHIGHALNLTLQDVLCRFQRQQGKNVLWIPGTDHAGIATQNVVERQLKVEGKTRDDLGREKFIERVWEWREEKGGAILEQVRRLGASVDWSRERFTMDEGLTNAVREVFVRLYNDGLIYKGKYIINWCNRCHTALADDEVEHAPHKGNLWNIRYNLADSDESLVVATSRPETLFGDMAVAVHPDDERYTKFIGKKVKLPLTDREIPIIADSYVDMEFGTACLKVTPAHDMNDWELGKRHGLDVLQVINDQGLMNDECPKDYIGLTKEACRDKVVADLKEQGLLVGVEDLEHSVGECYRCKSVVEPHVSIQWFVSMKPLAEKARKAVPAETKIFPVQWEKTYYNWLDNIRDWCISRQIWWGHRIPAWECTECGELIVAVDTPTACTKCSCSKLVQESDVLDTWFSSALWPFSTLGWPEQTEELAKYYPTAVLVTGFDILFFWVARMMMLGLHVKEQVPFHHVYLHALVRDEHGKKMSKSTGNVIDPIEMIDKYGTDALRFTLTVFAAMGRDIKLSEKRIEGYRFFSNKIWNAARFALMNLPADLEYTEKVGPSTLADSWILCRLELLKKETKEALSQYRFNDMAQGLYKFIWNEFCDWYLELIKPVLYGEDSKKEQTQNILHRVLAETMILLHPIMPFITQEIWSALPSIAERDMAKLLYPTERLIKNNEKVCGDMQYFQEIVSAVRNIRTELGIEPARKLTAFIRVTNKEQEDILQENKHLLINLARLTEVSIGQNIEAIKASGSAVVQGSQVFVPLEGVINFDTELARLEKDRLKIEKEHTMLSKKLANAEFVTNAPKQVVEKEKEKVAELDEKLNKLGQLQTRLLEAMQENK